MNRFLTTGAALLALVGSAGAASAQPRHDDRRDDHRYEQQRHDDRRDDHRYEQRADNHDRGHRDWRAGGRIERGDWQRGQRVDYRRHHLRAPPRGYEWRQVDNNYVLAAAATGLIASIIVAGR